MLKKFIILFAMVGVCSLIAANLYSNMVSSSAEANSEATETATSNAPALDIEALKKVAAENPTKPTVPDGAVDVAYLRYGNADAPIIIEEFASFTCSHCASFHRDLLPQLKSRLLDTGLAQLRVYSFVRNAQDLEATMLVQCQSDNDARRQFHNALMNGQEQWSLSTDYQKGLKTIARVGGMTDEAYEKCVADESLQEKIIASRQWFDKQVKVDATPYFRIGDEVVKGSRDAAFFEQAIQNTLQKKNAPAQQ